MSAFSSSSSSASATPPPEAASPASASNAYPGQIEQDVYRAAADGRVRLQKMVLDIIREVKYPYGLACDDLARREILVQCYANMLAEAKEELEAHQQRVAFLKVATEQQIHVLQQLLPPDSDDLIAAVASTSVPASVTARQQQQQAPRASKPAPVPAPPHASQPPQAHPPQISQQQPPPHAPLSPQVPPAAQQAPPSPPPAAKKKIAVGNARRTSDSKKSKVEFPWVALREGAPLSAWMNVGKVLHTAFKLEYPPLAEYAGAHHTVRADSSLHADAANALEFIATQLRLAILPPSDRPPYHVHVEPIPPVDSTMEEPCELCGAHIVEQYEVRSDDGSGRRHLVCDFIAAMTF